MAEPQSPVATPPPAPAAADPTVQDLIRQAAQKYKIPASLALGVGEQESGFNPGATGPKLRTGESAVGTFQILPSTAKALGIDPSDPHQNIEGGVKYLRQLMDQHHGDREAVLRAYGGVRADTTYVPAVTARIEKYQAMEPPEAPTAPAVTPVVAKQPGQTGEDVPQPGTPPPGPPETWSSWGVRQGKALLSTFDPRNPEGRRNLAGGLGAAAATGAVIGTAPVSVPVGLVTAGTAGILGAIGGGMAAEGGEQLVGTKPPSSAEVVKAGAQQGAYETAGLGATGLVKAVGRRIAARQMGKAIATEGSQLTERALAPLRQAFSATESKGAKAGRAAQAVIEGPAQHSLDEAGQRVSAAAASGPTVNIQPLKAEAQRILETEIRPPQEAFPKTSAAQVSADQVSAASGMSPEAFTRLQESAAAEGPGSVRARQLQVIQDAVTSAQGEGEKDVLKHPAMGVLNRILNAKDQVSFADAHAFKRELDDAIGGAWDRSVKSRVTNITKKLRGELRGTLAGHPPYDEATAHYAQIVPLFRKEIAPKLRKLADTQPEALLDLIKGNRPGPLRMLKDVLTTQAAEGGGVEGATQGRAAWDTVRAAWLHDKLIGQDLTAIPAKLAKLDPAFAETMLGDPAGRQVRTNLEQLGRVAKAAQASRQPTPVGGGISLRGAVYGWIPIKKLIVGPRAADVAAWAALAPERTQAWVKFVASPTPKTAQTLALLARDAPQAVQALLSGLIQPAPSHPVGAPPPEPGVGTPPPGRIAASAPAR